MEIEQRMSNAVQGTLLRRAEAAEQRAEALQAENDRLRAALQNLVAHVMNVGSWSVKGHHSVDLARAALSGSPDKSDKLHAAQDAVVRAAMECREDAAILSGPLKRACDELAKLGEGE